jgi:AbrB family looped-hinge helix DNA binding protein
MTESILNEKNQCIIPKTIRDCLNLNPGDKIDFLIQDNGEVIVKPVNLDIRDLHGVLKQSGTKPVSLEEMERAVQNNSSRIPD